MTKTVSPLLQGYRRKPVILDSNILLFYWCTRFDPELVNTSKRLNGFFESDIHLLQSALKHFSCICTTPHVLAEVSNLANSLPKWRKEEWGRFFADQITVVEEEWTPAQTISKTPAFYLGITDAALFALASTHVIMTVDFPLSNYLESKKLMVINFNHLRECQYE